MIRGKSGNFVCTNGTYVLKIADVENLYQLVRPDLQEQAKLSHLLPRHAGNDACTLQHVGSPGNGQLRDSTPRCDPNVSEGLLEHMSMHVTGGAQLDRDPITSPSAPQPKSAAGIAACTSCRIGLLLAELTVW